MTAAAVKQTEASFQSAVVDLARLAGWRVHAERPARTVNGWRTPITGHVGFPDLILVRGPRLIAAELKSGTGRLSPDQAAWLVDLEAAGAETHVWRPSDWDAVVALLRAGGSSMVLP